MIRTEQNRKSFGCWEGTPLRRANPVFGSIGLTRVLYRLAISALRVNIVRGRAPEFASFDAGITVTRDPTPKVGVVVAGSKYENSALSIA